MQILALLLSLLLAAPAFAQGTIRQLSEETAVSDSDLLIVQDPTSGAAKKATRTSVLSGLSTMEFKPPADGGTPAMVGGFTFHSGVSWPSQSARDENWSIQYNNNGAAANQIKWGENIESNYDTSQNGSGPFLFEKNWDYTSVDRVTSFRPFNFSINNVTYAADMRWNVTTYQIHHRSATNGGMTVKIVTTPGSETIQYNGQVTVNAAGVEGNGSYRFHLRGTPIGAVMLGIAPTGITTGDIMLNITSPSLTGTINWMNAESSASVLGQVVYRNTGAGGTHHLMWAGSAGDTWTRYLAATDWSVGNDRSDSGKFKISNGDTLGTNDRFVLDTAGNVALVGYIQTVEVTAPSAPASNGVRLYAVDNGSGKTQLMALFSSGAAQQLAIQP